MTITLPTAPRRAGPVRRFLRTPKGYLLLILTLLTAVGAPAAGLDRALSGLAWAVATAMLLDLALVRLLRKTWGFPSGALLTGLILGLVLSPGEPWFVEAGAAALAIGSKHLFRNRWANVFNPAALGLVAIAPLFAAGQSWWGALPDLPLPALLVLLGTGAFIVHRLNKLPMVLVFLGAYFLLFTLAAFLAAPAQVAEIFRPPDLNAALFFAFFMLDDPPTCPVRYPDQVIYALIVAGGSFAVYMALGAVYFLPAGVLAGNIWEAWRREVAHGGRRTTGV